MNRFAHFVRNCSAQVFFLPGLLPLLISAFATTHQQASIFGAVSVVILSAIGGIWVPTFLMPKFLKALSVVSPLNWGIEGFYKIILRGEGLVSVLPRCFLLLAFAAVCFAVSVLAKRRKGL
jgi:ABC-2 type transport system permease protein